MPATIWTRFEQLRNDWATDATVICAFPEGEQGLNVARLIGLIAGLPQSVAGATLNRFCGSSMQGIHMAAGAIAMGAGQAFICAGLESMTRVPMMGFNPMPNPALAEKMKGAYMPLLFLALVTLFGGYLVKIYAWKSILGREGILNKFLLWTGIIDEPLDALLYSVNGVVITLTYFLLPFAILPIYGTMRAIRPATIESARDLGAGRWAVLRDIVIPQCEKGIVIAFTFAFLIAAGDYVTPRFVGGGAAMMGHFIELQFSLGFNWPMGSAMAWAKGARWSCTSTTMRS